MATHSNWQVPPSMRAKVKEIGIDWRELSKTEFQQNFDEFNPQEITTLSNWQVLFISKKSLG